MRDIIWTLIILWLVFRLVAVFKNIAQKKSNHQFQNRNPEPEFKTSNSQKDLKSALKKHLNSEGEYVDYEEVK